MTIQDIHFKLEHGYNNAMINGDYSLAEMYLQQFDQSLQLILGGKN